MINLVFIIPYPELEEIVQNAFQHHPLRDQLRERIEMRTADELENITFNSQSDVIIARGCTVFELRKIAPNLPVIEIPINAYDLIHAVNECISIYSPPKIGFIANHTALPDAKALERVVHCQVNSYCCDTIDDLNSVLDIAYSDGCTAFVGGYSVYLSCKEKGLNCVMIQTGCDAITSALNEAIRTVEVMRKERERSEMFSLITQTAKDAIVYVDEQMIIKICNPSALAIYSGPKTDLIGLPLASTFPFFYKFIEQALNTSVDITNQLIHWKNYTFNATIHPVAVNSRNVGAVLTFQDITQIQQMEIKIRKKLNDKGLNARYHFKDIIHQSVEMNNIINRAQRYAAVSSNILIEGETGTGKELFAQSIHNMSERKNGPFVAVNCAALPENLLESELFGYVEGAFTGTSKGGKSGLFELAHKGTLFLDEISEIPLSIQGKLLRVLQEREVRRVGGDHVISVDVRIIAATNRNLKQITEQGNFRLDLLYRLDVLKLFIPPLRKRSGDAQILFMHYLEYYYSKQKGTPPKVAPSVLQTLSEYSFPGNIRELRNVTERLVVMCMGKEEISEEDIREALYPEEIPVKSSVKKIKKIDSYSNVERDYLIKQLETYNYNQTLTAKALGIDRSTLWRRMKKCGIKRQFID